MTRPPAYSGPAAASPFVSVSFGPRRAGQLHARLRTPPRQSSSVLLRIDKRAFPMIVRGTDAFVADPALERAALGLMRTGVTLAVDIRSASGARLRDTYTLRGAASAIDAAAVACARG